MSWLVDNIPVIGNMAGQIIANRGAIKQQKLANEQNIKFWNMQNEYNHPSAQMERMRKAGLNPALMYGSSTAGASGNAGNIAPAKAAEVKNISNMPMLTYQDIKQKEAQTDNLRAQNTVLAQEAMLKIAQAQALDSNRALTDFDLRQKQRMREIMNQIQYKTLDNLNQEVIGKTISNEVAKQLVTTNVDIRKQELKKVEQEVIGKTIENHIADKTQAVKIQNSLLEYSQRIQGMHGVQLQNEIMQIEKDMRLKGIQSSPWYIQLLSKVSGNSEVQAAFDKIDNFGTPKHK